MDHVKTIAELIKNLYNDPLLVLQKFPNFVIFRCQNINPLSFSHVARVGKTSLSTKFVHGNFDKQQSSTVDASYLEKQVQVGEKRIKMVIWDTAGQEKYHALARNYYQGASGALLVYDVTDEDSFQRAKKWYTELRREIGAEAPIILAGNKCDILNHTV